jgi:chemotaxis protein MotB
VAAGTIKQTFPKTALQKAALPKLKETAASRVNVVYNGGHHGRGAVTAHDVGAGGGEHGESEGTWIFSYADMITILMMFFILLLSISSLDVQKFEQLKGAMATSATQNAAGENRGNAGENAAQSSSGINQTREEYTLEPGVGTVSFRRLAEKTAGVSAADSNTQIIAAIETLLAAVDQKKIEKGSQQAKTFEAMRQKISQLSEVMKGEKSLEGRQNQEIKLALATKGLFAANNTLTKNGSAVVAKLAASILALDPFPQVVISSFVAKAEEPNATKALLLSNTRAAALFNVLVANKLSPNFVAMAGYGHAKALLSEKDSYGNPIRAAEDANSRIEISILRRRDYRK